MRDKMRDQIFEHTVHTDIGFAEILGYMIYSLTYSVS